MKIAEIFAIAAGFVATGLATVRWLRVAQREHYLAGSVTRFATRWWRSGVVGPLGFIVATFCVIGSVFDAPVLFGTTVVVALGPLGLGLRGRTSKLRWTRRLTTVAVVSALMNVIIVVGGSIAGGLHGAVVAVGGCALLSPLIVDGSLAMLSPVERQIGARYVHRAAARFATVCPTVVGITGSYGKTSTKLYVAHLLSGRLQVLASPGSYNNQAGLSRTVNELLVPGTDVLVAEMGAYGPGEIAAICRWLPPEIAVITAIGPVHLERFKTLDRTLAAKSEITVGTRAVVLNVDDERLAGLAERLATTAVEVVTCSALRNDVTIGLLALGEDRFELFVAGKSFGPVVISGGMAPTNVACAIGVAHVLGCAGDEIAQRVASLPVSPHRLEARSATSGASILDDTFNSNPAGARLALAQLGASSPGSAKRVLVTPGMVELGSLQAEANAAFAKDAASVATHVLVVGTTNKKALHDGLEKAAVADLQVLDVRNRDEAVHYVAANLNTGDVVLYENDLPDHYP